uniref:GEO02112p1 n=1 Tax=Drosophila melanogaster TaxID=7227 RepID=Q4V6C1_DROME|eukprot:NP_001189106.1 uncharacterized protein Dmel_CG42758 [Drosophila melanogaster]
MCMQVPRFGCRVPVSSSRCKTGATRSCRKPGSRYRTFCTPPPRCSPRSCCTSESCCKSGSCCGPCGSCSNGCAACLSSCCGIFPETCCGPWCESCLDPSWFSWLAPDLGRSCCCACMTCCRSKC